MFQERTTVQPPYNGMQVMCEPNGKPPPFTKSLARNGMQSLLKTIPQPKGFGFMSFMTFFVKCAQKLENCIRNDSAGYIGILRGMPHHACFALKAKGKQPLMEVSVSTCQDGYAAILDKPAGTTTEELIRQFESTALHFS